MRVLHSKTIAVYTMQISHVSKCEVADNNTAERMGSGDLPVFATPAMVALMENAAMLAAKKTIEKGETTVGGFISATHLKPSKIGETISATAVLVRTEGNRLFFEIEARDSKGVLIGKSEHVRFIVDGAKFMEKIGQS